MELALTDTRQFLSFVFTKSLSGLRINIFFTYVLVYALSPIFLWKERYFSFIFSTVLLLTGLIFYQYSLLLKAYPVSPTPGDIHAIKAAADKWYLFRCAWENIMFNCPASGGTFLSIKLLKRWYLKQQETQQLTMAKTSAELQILKAQVHPHFLFNTLNNIYFFILSESPAAPVMIRKLSGLLRYIVYECDLDKVPLEKELAMIQDYLQLENIRYGERLNTTLDIQGDVKSKMIAPLLLLPFVENSFKHGASKMLDKPWIKLTVTVENSKLFFTLTNGKPNDEIRKVYTNGIGLNNVQKRLQLLYPNMHKLSLKNEPWHYSVILEIILLSPAATVVRNRTRKKEKGFEIA